MLYIILAIHPQDEQKPCDVLCREGQLALLRKQVEGGEKFAFCKCKVCSPISREVSEVTRVRIDCTDKYIHKFVRVAV